MALLAGPIAVQGVQGQPGDLDPAAIGAMDLDATVYNLALARNALGAAMLEHAKRHPGAAEANPVAIAPTASESARFAALSDNALEGRIEALSAEVTDLTDHGKSLQQQGQPISQSMIEVAQRLAETYLSAPANSGLQWRQAARRRLWPRRLQPLTRKASAWPASRSSSST